MQNSNLSNQINQDLISALKEKDNNRAMLLRTLRASLQNAEIEKRNPLTDEEVQKIIQKEVKKRQEAAVLYKQGQRLELAEKENQEVKILQAYLPEQLTEEELTQLIKEAIQQSGALSTSDLGKVMGIVIPKISGRADNSRVAISVRELLEENE